MFYTSETQWKDEMMQLYNDNLLFALIYHVILRGLPPQQLSHLSSFES